MGRRGTSQHPPTSVHQWLQGSCDCHMIQGGDHMTHVKWDWHSAVWKIHHMRRWGRAARDHVSIT